MALNNTDGLVIRAVRAAGLKEEQIKQLSFLKEASKWPEPRRRDWIPRMREGREASPPTEPEGKQGSKKKEGKRGFVRRE